MREIKFQAIHRHYKNGDVIFSEWGPCDGVDMVIGSGPNFISPPSIVGYNFEGHRQFTGLKDKNGKEIYEDDFVRCFGCPSGMSDRKEYIGKVVQDTFGWTIVILYKNEWWAYGSMDYSTLEVIGNIYQNLELIK